MPNTTSEKKHLRDVLTAFWDEQFRIEETASGLAAAMPLMNASGWQVVVHLEPVTPGYWLINDQGETLGGLDDAGKNPDTGKVRESVEAQCRFYGLQRDGLTLQKAIRYPFDPVEIQIFAEGLVALSHLPPKRQAEVVVNPLHRMEASVQGYFDRKSWTPIRRHKLRGQVEREIVVDFYSEERRPLAVQPVGRNRQLRGYMEQWGWRWTDLGREHPDLIKAMVFDPDNQEWDLASQKIGEKVCDVFVPYTEVDEALDSALAA
ncbi:MAG: hypothetical protein ACI9UA_003997 [Pseudoalteromonas tetraodonis]|jgi:hypothetical protein